MSLQKRLLIAAVILVLIGLVFFFLTQKKEKIERPLRIVNQPLTNQELINNQPGTTNQPRELSPEEKSTLLKNELKIKARNFTERYGSFSTDAIFANLRELKNEMSRNFWQKTESYILQKEKEGNPEEFYGITTKVLNIQEKSFLPNQLIEFSVNTQRQETKGQIAKVFYQNLQLKMILENESWLVDSVEWQENFEF